MEDMNAEVKQRFLAALSDRLHDEIRLLEQASEVLGKLVVDKTLHEQKGWERKAGPAMLKGSGLPPVGEEMTEVLAHGVGGFYVKRYLKPGYLDPGTGIVYRGVEPYQAFSDLRVDESVAALLIVQHVLKQQSFDRIAKYFARQGVNFSENHLRDIFLRACHIMFTDERKNKRAISGQGALAASDTTIPVFDNEKGHGKAIGYYRAYAHVPSRSVFFSFQRGRKVLPPDWTILDVTGMMQAASWEEGADLEKETEIRRIGSMAYLRGRFRSLRDAGISGTEGVVAVLDAMKAQEDGFLAEGLTGASRQAARAMHIRPLFAELRRLLESLEATEGLHARLSFLVREVLGDLDRYTCHVEDGDIEADLQLPDHGIPLLGKPPRAYLYAPSPEAALRMCKIYGFAATCHWRGQDPLEWFRAALEDRI